MNDVADTIVSYIELGVAVFPLWGVQNGRCLCGHRDCGVQPDGTITGSPGKHPLLGLAHRKDDPARATCHGECGRIGHGLYDATTDTGQVAEWLAQHPGCNWAIRPPAGVLILDVDIRNDGPAELTKLTDAHGALPATLTARTGSGGLHIWLTYNGPTRGKLCKGVDCKTSKGYVVAPPSTHISGGTYEWINKKPAAYAPQWVKDRMNPPIRRISPTRTGKRIDGLFRHVASLKPGQRNNQTWWAMVTAVEDGLDPTPLVDAAVAAGLSTSEAEAALRSALRHTRGAA